MIQEMKDMPGQTIPFERYLADMNSRERNDQNYQAFKAREAKFKEDEAKFKEAG